MEKIRKLKPTLHNRRKESQKSNIQLINSTHSLTSQDSTRPANYCTTRFEHNNQPNNQQPLLFNQQKQQTPILCYKYVQASRKSQNNQELSLFNLVENLKCATKQHVYNGIEKSQILKPRYGRIEPEMTKALIWIGGSAGQGFSWLLRAFKGEITKKQLKRILAKLIKLKWIIRIDKVYYLNPFLEALIRMKPAFRIFFRIASLQVDFFDLLNYPLLKLIELRKKNTKAYRVERIELKIRKFRRGEANIRCRAFFWGFCLIRLHLADNRGIVETILPINLHGQYIFTKNRFERELLPHFTIPLKWKIFGVKEAQFVSGWQDNLQKTLFIHFDNSIKVLAHPDMLIRLSLTRKFNKALEYWQNYEYVEVNDLRFLEEIFKARFIENKSGLKLFRRLGLTVKRLGGKKKKPKKRRLSKIEQKEKSIRQVDLFKLLKSENSVLQAP